MLPESFRMGVRERMLGWAKSESERELLWCCVVLRKRSHNRCSHCFVGLGIVFFIALRVILWAARCNTDWTQRMVSQVSAHLAVLIPAHPVPAVEASR